MRWISRIRLAETSQIVLLRARRAGWAGWCLELGGKVIVRIADLAELRRLAGMEGRAVPELQWIRMRPELICHGGVQRELPAEVQE